MPIEPRVDILIRSYWRDLGWLEQSLRSIERFCTGFGRVIAALPKGSLPYLKRHPSIEARAEIIAVPDYRDDYLGQQVTKLHGDLLSQADFITHVDSDVIFCAPLEASALFCEARPIVVYRNGATCDRHWPWGGPAGRFLGRKCATDFMCRPPFTYPRDLYAEIRDFCRKTHGQDLADYVIGCPARGFSEFNVLGAFAFEHRRADFEWVEQEESEAGGYCRWYWSWGGLDQRTLNDIERVLEC